MELKYYKDIDSRIRRYRQFYESDKPALLVLINRSWGDKKTIIPVSLADFDFSDAGNVDRYLDLLVDNLEISIYNRSCVFDDYIPVTFPYYGQAIFSTYLWDRNVKYFANTSWADPCILNWDDADNLKLDDNNFWIRLNSYSLEYLKNKMRGIGFVRSPNYGPLDLANALRGNDLFIDFYDYPEQLHRLLGFCMKAFIWKSDMDKKVIGDVGGGRAGHWGIWYPDNTGEMSIDASTMISPAIFEEFEMPYIQQILDYYGWYTIHTHSAGAHQYDNYRKLNGLRVMNLSTDPNVKDPAEDIENIVDKLGTTPILLSASYAQISRNIKLMKKGRFIISTSAQSDVEAHEILELIRKNSRVSD